MRNIPIDAFRETLATARMGGSASSKATKNTMRVLYNDNEFGSLKNMLNGKRDWLVEATMDDMLYPSGTSPESYLKDGYSANSMAKLPKNTISNPGARAKVLARNQAGMTVKGSAIAKRRAILKNMKNRK